MENTASASAPTSWLLNLIERTRLVSRMLAPIGRAFLAMTRWSLRFPQPVAKVVTSSAARKPAYDWIFNTVLVAVAAFLLYRVYMFVSAGVSLADVGHVALLGFYTLLRVMLLIVLASLVWVPLGVMIGLRPRLAELVQPLAQFLAAFPANLLFSGVRGVHRAHPRPSRYLA